MFKSVYACRGSAASDGGRNSRQNRGVFDPRKL